MELNDLFKKNVSCRVGKGERTQFWLDEWIGEGTLCVQFPHVFNISNAKNAVVADMLQFDQNGTRWDFQLRRERYEWEEEQFHQLMTLMEGVQIDEANDMWRWKPDRHGNSSVKSFYEELAKLEILQSQGATHIYPYRLVWKVDIPSKVQFFMWTVMHNRILTADNLIHRGSQVNPRCSFCDNLNESISHLLLHCSVSLNVWSVLMMSYPEVYPNLFTVVSVEEWLNLWPPGTHQEFGSKVWSYLPYAVFWTLWKTRNHRIFRQKTVDVEAICREVKFTIWYWCSSWKRRKKYRYQDLDDKWSDVLTGLIHPL
ncbi:hypothetical protein FRX31_031782 [Thalictrum thalictroides]|uniref:Reverse transcriptase zinc-binding domain-containing protein n=1 Tax=Thalictrum thalictroides TaxID=46969 RepID=A0A7J6V1D5_THATH|nr:hypothetical protein FRX31_031782 [Thalictrum thalictroides]